MSSLKEKVKKLEEEKQTVVKKLKEEKRVIANLLRSNNLTEDMYREVKSKIVDFYVYDSLLNFELSREESELLEKVIDSFQYFDEFFGKYRIG